MVPVIDKEGFCCVHGKSTITNLTYFSFNNTSLDFTHKNKNSYKNNDTGGKYLNLT